MAEQRRTSDFVAEVRQKTGDAVKGMTEPPEIPGVRATDLEPYVGRTPDLVARDVLALSTRWGIREYWIYLSDGPAPEAWLKATESDSFPSLSMSSRIGTWNDFSAASPFAQLRVPPTAV